MKGLLLGFPETNDDGNVLLEYITSKCSAEDVALIENTSCKDSSKTCENKSPLQSIDKNKMNNIRRKD